MRVRLSLALLAVAAAALLVLGPAQGAFPGSNGLIAYSCGSLQVCVVNPDGSSQRTLIDPGGDPAWSPGGTKIAYANNNTIYTANADGGNALPFADNALQPTWSSNGSTIAFIDANGYVAVKTSTGTTELTATGSSASDPAISPNGQTIAYSAQAADAHWHIFTIPIGGGTPTNLTPTQSDLESGPTWAPNGATIVFENLEGLAKVPSSGGTPTQIVTSDANDPAYSPDGTKIVYDANDGSLWVVDASGANPIQIVNSFANASLPDWGSAPLSTGGGPGTPSDTADGPVNTSYPVITLATGDSSPVVGHTLFASTGTWTGTFPISYSYQWKRCDPSDPVNGQCIDIANATSSVYVPTSNDYGFRLRIAVSATNPDGRHTQNSEVTTPTIALAPKNTVTPPIAPAGTNRVGDTLSVTNGTWSGSTPIAFTYSWRRCDPVGDPATCVPIDGATSSTYVPTVADIGFSLRVWITGTNVAGSDVSVTNHTFPILDKLHFAPSVATAPTIAGTALPGRQLTANIGSFEGDTPLATSFRWYRCNANGAQCHAVPNGTKITYFPTRADVGYTLELVVAASNAYGKLTAVSKPTDTVAAEPPHVRGKRIVGTNAANYLAGGGHDDIVIGRGGNDTILGGAGDDLLEGGAGNDVITGGARADRIFGGPGSDTIYANDGEKDVIDCGAGDDRAVVDAYDVTKNCEVVSPAPSP